MRPTCEVENSQGLTFRGTEARKVGSTFEVDSQYEREAKISPGSKAPPIIFEMRLVEGPVPMEAQRMQENGAMKTPRMMATT